MARRTWTAEEKMNIVLKGMVPGVNISEVCRQHGILQPQHYKWRDAFLQGGLSALSSSRTSSREKELEQELLDVKQLLGEKEVQIQILRKKTNWARK
jgi:transposase